MENKEGIDLYERLRRVIEGETHLAVAQAASALLAEAIVHGSHGDDDAIMEASLKMVRSLVATHRVRKVM